jgi:hypothetical protein
MSALEQFAGRRVLFLNWRDLSNPAAGGAEAYAEQIARRFARAGALLTLFTSTFQDAPPHDWADEYLVIREGGRFGVYLAAARHLKRHRHPVLRAVVGAGRHARGRPGTPRAPGAVRHVLPLAG